MHLVERALQFFMAQLPAALGLNGGLLIEGLPFPLTAVTVTILNGQSLSGAANLSAAGVPVAYATDAAWDTNIMSFQGSHTGAAYDNLRLFGIELQIPGVVASAREPVDPKYFWSTPYIKVRSGTAAAPVPQVGDTVITILCRPF